MNVYLKSFEVLMKKKIRTCVWRRLGDSRCLQRLRRFGSFLFVLWRFYLRFGEGFEQDLREIFFKIIFFKISSKNFKIFFKNHSRYFSRILQILPFDLPRVFPLVNPRISMRQLFIPLSSIQIFTDLKHLEAEKRVYLD